MSSCWPPNEAGATGFAWNISVPKGPLLHGLLPRRPWAKDHVLGSIFFSGEIVGAGPSRFQKKSEGWSGVDLQGQQKAPQVGRFLFVAWDGGGALPPLLGLARQLLARGHQVLVMGGETVAAEAQAVGAHFVPHVRAPHHAARDRDRDLICDWGVSPLRTLRRLRQTLLFGPVEAYALDLLEALKSFDAQVVVADSALLGAFVGAEIAGLPYVPVFPNLYPLPLEGAPPSGSGWQQASNWFTRLRAQLMNRLLDTFWRSGTPMINEARARLGLQALPHTFVLYQRAAALLVLTTEAFAAPLSWRPLRWPERVFHVGPLLDDPGWAQRESPVSLALDNDRDEPLILVSIGSTYQRQERFVECVIQALSRLPVRGLVTLGEVLPPDAWGILPPQIQVLGALPHRQVLPHTQVVVSHGGHGTVLKALSYGVPILCAPFGRDQPDNAARIVANGAGLRCSRNASASQIERALRRLLTEPSFTTQAKRLQRAIQEDMEESQGCSILEEML